MVNKINTKKSETPTKNEVQQFHLRQSKRCRHLRTLLTPSEFRTGFHTNPLIPVASQLSGSRCERVNNIGQVKKILLFCVVYVCFSQILNVSVFLLFMDSLRSSRWPCLSSFFCSLSCPAPVFFRYLAFLLVAIFSLINPVNLFSICCPVRLLSFCLGYVFRPVFYSTNATFFVELVPKQSSLHSVSTISAALFCSLSWHSFYSTH